MNIRSGLSIALFSFAGLQVACPSGTDPVMPDPNPPAADGGVAVDMSGPPPGPGHQLGGAIQQGPLNLLGQKSILAGTEGVYGAADGTGPSAQFVNPVGVTTDGTNVYVTDNLNNTIRKVEIATGVTTTVAGMVGMTGTADGTGSAARFFSPTGITTDGKKVYVADGGNHMIRQIDIATSVVTTLAGGTGPGTTDGVGAAARFFGPHGITTDGTSLFVADTRNNTLRKIDIASKTVTTLAGSGQAVDVDGTGLAAGFNSPKGITTDGTSLYVSDFGANTLRKVRIADATVTTLAGTAGQAGTADGVGAAARFNSPTGLTTDGTSVFLADSNRNTVRQIVLATATVTTLARGFSLPYDVTSNGTRLFVADSGHNTIAEVK